MPKRIYELPNGALIDLAKICSITNVRYHDGPEVFIFEIHSVGGRNTIFRTNGILIRCDTRKESENERNKIRKAWEKCLNQLTCVEE